MKRLPNTREDFHAVRARYGCSMQELQAGLKETGGGCLLLALGYADAMQLAVNVRKDRHGWNMARAEAFRDREAPEWEDRMVEADDAPGIHPGT